MAVAGVVVVEGEDDWGGLGRGLVVSGGVSGSARLERVMGMEVGVSSRVVPMVLTMMALAEGGREVVVLEMVVAGALEGWIWVAITLTLCPNLVVADGMVLMVVRVSDGFSEDVVAGVIVVPEVVAVAAPEEVVGEGWDDGGVVLLLEMSLAGPTRFETGGRTTAKNWVSRIWIEAARRTLNVSHVLLEDS